MTDKIFISAAAGFILGVSYASFFPASVALVVFLALTGTVSLVAALLQTNHRKSAILFALFLLFAAIGVLRFYMKDAREPKHLLDNFLEENVALEGVINSETESRQNSQRIVLSAENLEHLGTNYKIDSKILVTTDFFPEFYYGDRIRVSGKLKSPENFTTEIGKTFDYKSYLKRDSIYYTMSFAKIEFINDGEGSFVKTSVLSLKERFLSNIEKLIPAPASGLMAGLLLGVKGSLGDKLHQAFVDTGLVHIIVLSGYNVTIIAEAVIKTLSFAGVAAGIYAGGVFILLFAVMAGGGATIIRASVMAILALIARATGRTYEITRALLVAAVVMIFYNPYVLIFDISFQLSFLATLGLIYVTPVFEKLFRKLPNFMAIRDITSATFATQVFVLPFLLYKIGNLSVIAPITNILVLPVVPMTMFFGFLAGLVGFIAPVVGTPFALIAFALLKYEIFIVELFAKFPFASFTISQFPILLMIICYILIVLYLYKFYNRKANAKEAA